MTGNFDFSKARNPEITAILAAIDACLDSPGVVQGGAAIDVMKTGVVTLGGHNPTSIVFLGSDGEASIKGIVAVGAGFVLANGLTLIADVDGIGDKTATFVATVGSHKSGLNPSIDLHLGEDYKFNIQVDDDVGGPQLVELTLGSCTDGTATAAEMEATIQALGGVYAGVTVSYTGTPVTDYYTISSGTLGSGSKIRVTRAVDHNITEELKIGPDGGAADTDGTGDAVNIALATIDEVIVRLNTDLTDSIAAADGNYVRITSKTTGAASSIAVNAASTADLILGITGAAYGKVGMSMANDMADANYVVMAQVVGGCPCGLGISIDNRATTGFDIMCENEASVADIMVLIAGLEGA